MAGALRANGIAAAILSIPALGACAAAVPDVRARPAAAVIDAPGDVPSLAACLRAAYADDPFRFRVEAERYATRIVAFGSPPRLAFRWARPRFAIEVSDAGPGVARVVLRTVPTLLGPEAEVARLRARVAACAGTASPPAPAAWTPAIAQEGGALP